ncbi:DUF3618 domain-containing protein [Planomonospora venezuelensis]|uniref:DUF3618 domain-containing protein n=1 Tax=Planomonospora venezuelensis TaxID=1999 RepID=A0A841D8E9_PLAVE|nr:DUF3618 domain-containing protein [Planomonospora venezuelensis]MBB5964857.1 hypothetical protein [Planomonospora venezuelensis]GIM62330.1 hypothetical protein Pve01_75580 [Planomonospora venezuelensis]
MSETDPGRPGRDLTEAGTTGARRQEIGTPVPPDERGSLNIQPKEPGLSPAAGTGGTPSGETGDDRLGADETPDERRRGTLHAVGDDRTAAPAGTASEEAVRRDIEETRRELGDTVEALAHKTDVKGRVHETAAHMGDDLKSRVQGTAAQVGDDLKRMGNATASTATGLVDRVKEAGPGALEAVREATPAKVRHATGRVSAEAGRRPVATMAVAGAVAMLVVRMLRRRRAAR